MCELFAVNSSKPLHVNRYLEEFYSHSQKHRHGWGLTYRTGEVDNPVALWREPVAAHQSHVLPSLLSAPIEATHLQAHIRLATCGTLSVENCHPFVGSDISGRDWTLIHNGILFNEGLLWGYEAKEAGQTDSERVMLYLMDVLDEALLRSDGSGRRNESIRFAETFDALTGAVSQLGNLNKLNIILDDGTYTYIHTNTDGVTLRWRELDGGIIFSTEALGGLQEADAWKPVPANRLIAYRDGRLIRASAPHGNVFCEAILEIRRALGDVWDPETGTTQAQTATFANAR